MAFFLFLVFFPIHFSLKKLAKASWPPSKKGRQPRKSGHRAQDVGRRRGASQDGGRAPQMGCLQENAKPVMAWCLCAETQCCSEFGNKPAVVMLSSWRNAKSDNLREIKSLKKKKTTVHDLVVTSIYIVLWTLKINVTRSSVITRLERVEEEHPGREWVLGVGESQHTTSTVANAVGDTEIGVEEPAGQAWPPEVWRQIGDDRDPIDLKVAVSQKQELGT